MEIGTRDKVSLHAAPSQLPYGFVRLLTHAAVPAGGKKERNAARHVRVDLCVQRLEVYLEQRPEQEGHGDEIEEESRCRCKVLRGEGRQRPSSL